MGILVLAGLLQPAWAGSQTKSDPAEARPEDLMVIWQRPVAYGTHLIGVYSVKADAKTPACSRSRFGMSCPTTCP